MIISKLLCITCLLPFIGTVLKPSRHTKHQHPLRWYKSFRTYLHLGPLCREAWPGFCLVVPANYFIIVLHGAVQTIQVGVVTIVVPPGTSIKKGTVSASLVIIPILGGKKHTAMITKRITSGTCKKKERESQLKTLFFFIEIRHDDSTR